MDIRLLDEQDRKEIEGINDISKKEIITNSNSNKDEIIGVNSKAKNEILQKIESTKKIDLFGDGLYQIHYQSSSSDYTINGDVELLMISVRDYYTYIELDGVKKSTWKDDSTDPLVLMSYDMFNKIYQPNLKIPYIYGGILYEKDISKFSIKVVDSFKDLPNSPKRGNLYFIKNFNGRNLHITNNNNYLNLYCEYILK